MFRSDGRLNPYKSGLVRGFSLGDDELADVLAFFEALTDQTFVENAAFTAPGP